MKEIYKDIPSYEGHYQVSNLGNVKRTIQDLIQIENNYFSEIERVDDSGLGDKLIANNLEFVGMILKMFDFNDFSKMQEVAVAYSIDREAIIKVSDEILTKNGTKQ